METLVDLEKIISTAGTLSAKLKSELDDLKTENELLQEENAEIKEKNQKLQEEMTTLRAVNEKLLGEGDNLRTEIHRLKDELELLAIERDNLLDARHTFGNSLNVLITNLNDAIKDNHEKFMSHINKLMVDECQKFLSDYSEQAELTVLNDDENNTEFGIDDEPITSATQTEDEKPATHNDTEFGIDDEPITSATQTEDETPATHNDTEFGIDDEPITSTTQTEDTKSALVVSGVNEVLPVQNEIGEAELVVDDAEILPAIANEPPKRIMYADFYAEEAHSDEDSTVKILHKKN